MEIGNVQRFTLTLREPLSIAIGIGDTIELVAGERWRVVGVPDKSTLELEHGATPPHDSKVNWIGGDDDYVVGWERVTHSADGGRRTWNEDRIAHAIRINDRRETVEIACGKDVGISAKAEDGGYYIVAGSPIVPWRATHLSVGPRVLRCEGCLHVALLPEPFCDDSDWPLHSPR